MKKTIIIPVLLIVLAIVIVCCARLPFYKQLRKTDSIAESQKSDAFNPQITHPRIEADLKRLNSYSHALEEMAAEMHNLRDSSRVYQLDYFPPEEHDKIESLLFRYLLCRRSLWGLVYYHVDYRKHFPDPTDQVKAFLIGFSAGLHIVHYSSLVVATFVNEDHGPDKLNEAFPRCDIPKGTYDMLFKQVTSLKNLKAIKVAWQLYERELNDSTSLLSRLKASDETYGRMIDSMDAYHKASGKRIRFILKSRYLLPDLENLLKQTVLTDFMDEAKASVEDDLYLARGILFTAVGDIKTPGAKPLKFTKEQKKRAKKLLKPGDIILTYSAGYMSNVFLPGNFKHGIIYIGDVDERKELGLSRDHVKDLPNIDFKEFSGTALSERLPDGKEIDAIEAVSEGVIFNSLSYLMDTHINRMVVLRPKVSEEEKMMALASAISLHGLSYDFKFDFVDGSYQCCTEVIYRAFNSKGPFDFDLTKRAGKMTLSADDIVQYYLANDPAPFSFVLFAEEDSDTKDNTAIIHAGRDGEKVFKDFVASKSKKKNDI